MSSFLLNKPDKLNYKLLNIKNMTPKEKAITLVQKYYCKIIETSKIKKAVSLKEAKEFAIICLDEKVESTNKFADYWDLKKGEWYSDEIKELESVRSELNNL